MKTEPAQAAGLRGLYAITPDWTDTPRLLSVTEAILGAGCRILQYRNKQASNDRRHEQAVALRGLTRKYGARLIVNDDLDLALFCAADGVHLGEDDGQLAAARAGLDAGSGGILGASCYQSLPLALAAARVGADYLAFGSFFASPTKPQAKRATPALIAETKRETGLPVCAIGGITTDNASGLIAAGADLLAVISALYDAPDPYQAALKFNSLFQEAHKEPA
ncbi:MAG: thiamine-phosphate diphosphorylase [Hydrogenophilales bacterium 28-61-23]|nr:MAG: thiamine-phosphate diphosphorylase [Hydrogenophilales bacterium 28-61-23]